MTDKARSELAPTGVLRAGINLSNFLLVTGRSANAEPVGVSPDMARAAAAALGVPPGGEGVEIAWLISRSASSFQRGVTTARIVMLRLIES